MTESSLRSRVRAQFGLERSRNIPVNVLPDSDQAPELSGTAGGFFTRGGTPIAFPSAYARRGWSNMFYQCCTREISVGAKWIPVLPVRWACAAGERNPAGVERWRIRRYRATAIFYHTWHCSASHHVGQSSHVRDYPRGYSRIAHPPAILLVTMCNEEPGPAGGAENFFEPVCPAGAEEK